MSGNLKRGSINIWSTNLGLNLAGGFNFKKQSYQELSEEAAKVRCAFLNMKRFGGEDNEPHLYLREERFYASPPQNEEMKQPQDM